MTHGLHHVTAVCSDPQQNVDFYTGVLGQRLVKVTVNFDDPSMYHLYYGDKLGSPGTAMTFFPFPGLKRGPIGRGQVARTSFSVPKGSLDFWADRLRDAGVEYTEERHFEEDSLSFSDPDGLGLALVATEDPREPWTGSGVGAEHASRGFHSVQLLSMRDADTLRQMEANMGFRELAADDRRVRLAVDEGLPHQIVDLLITDDQTRGNWGVGTHHHVAYRVPGDDEQEAFRQVLAEQGRHVTTQQERHYFRSIYFREPGGILFEIATDTPGFSVDEPVDHMGESLKLPTWFESHRPKIEAMLPKLTTPSGVVLP